MKSIGEYLEEINGISLLSQYKTFFINYGYPMPRFIDASSAEQKEVCVEFIKAGHTISETEAFFIDTYGDPMIEEKIKKM